MLDGTTDNSEMEEETVGEANVSEILTLGVLVVT